MIRVNLKTHECDAEGVPADLMGLSVESLADLYWTDPALGYQGFGYWPVMDARPALTLGQKYSDPTLNIDQATRVVRRQWRAVPLTAEEIKQAVSQKSQQTIRLIDAERDRHIMLGMPYVFSDGTEGTVQLRHERDILNVNAVATAAMMRTSADDTATKLEFRDQEDVTHQMTAPEILAMAQAVMAWISAHYAAAWAHKDAIKELVEAGDGEGVASYDITQGWPT